MPDISNIPAPRVPVVDDKGLMTRQWYRYLFNLFNLTNAGTSPTNANDLALMPQTDAPQGLSYSPSYPTGYGNGAGNTVTQDTSRTTDVTMNAVCGQITLFASATVAGTFSTFTVTNAAVKSTDVVIVNFAADTFPDRYGLLVTAVANGSFRIQIHNIVARAAAESPVINFAVISAVNV